MIASRSNDSTIASLPCPVEARSRYSTSKPMRMSAESDMVFQTGMRANSRSRLKAFGWKANMMMPCSVFKVRRCPSVLPKCSSARPPLKHSNTTTAASFPVPPSLSWRYIPTARASPMKPSDPVRSSAAFRCSALLLRTNFVSMASLLVGRCGFAGVRHATGLHPNPAAARAI